MNNENERSNNEPGPQMEADPFPGLALFVYVFLFWWFYMALGGCATASQATHSTGFEIVIGAPPRNTLRERALPADSQTCRVDFHPWNEPCNNP